MAGDTNVHSDEQEFIKFIIGFLRFGEDLALKDTSKEKQLRDALMRDLGLPGVTAVYHIVPKEFAKEMKEQMMEQNIPCLITSNPNGDYLFLVGSNHADDFEQIQHDVFSRSTSFARQATADEMIARCERLGIKKIASLEFGDPAMAAIGQQELYDSRVVCSMVNLDGHTKLYVDPNDLVRESGKDMVNMELRYAFYQASGDHDRMKLDLKKAQANYDLETVQMFAQAIKDGRSMVLGDAESLRDVPYLTCKDGEVKYHFMDGDGNHRETKFDIAPDATVSEIAALISRNAYGVRNKVLYGNIQEWRTAPQQAILGKIAQSDRPLRPTTNTINSKYKEEAENEALDRFVDLARRKKECVLGNSRFGNENSYLTAKDGIITCHVPGKEDVKIDLTDLDNAKERAMDAIKMVTEGRLSVDAIYREIEKFETTSPKDLSVEDCVARFTPKKFVDIDKEMETNMLQALEIISREGSTKALGMQKKDQTVDAFDLLSTKREIISGIIFSENYDLGSLLERNGLDPAFLDKVVCNDGLNVTCRQMIIDTVTHFTERDEKSEEEMIVRNEALTKETKTRIHEEQERSNGRVSIDVEKTEKETAVEKE